MAGARCTCRFHGSSQRLQDEGQGSDVRPPLLDRHPLSKPHSGLPTWATQRCWGAVEPMQASGGDKGC